MALGRNARRVFAEESDDESIATDTTADSERREEYEVEAILAERSNPGNGLEYLVDWESYPLYRATWEPVQNILSDVVLRNWADMKKTDPHGHKQAADVEKWGKAIEDHCEEQDEKKRKRQRKRRRRMVGTRANDDDVLQRASPRRRVKQQTVQRKGVAQRVTQRRHPTAEYHPLRDELNDSLEPESSDTSSLFTGSDDELQERPPTIVSREDSLTTNPTMPKMLNTSNNQNAAQSPVTKVVPEQQTAQTPITSVMVTSAPSLPSAPAITTTSKVPVKDIMANWNADNKRKARPRVSGKTPKDSAEPRFKNLAQQNRFQLYSRNERAPDLNALTVVDPKTGQAIVSNRDTQMSASSEIPPQPQPRRTASSSAIHSAYQRRTPPPVSQQKSPNLAQREDIPEPDQHELRDITEVCWYWENGKTCKYPEGQCPRAHWRIDPNTIVAPKQRTCWYWHTNGFCTKKDNDCRFAHHYTGIIAKPPQLRLTSGPPTSLRRTSVWNEPSGDNINVVPRKRVWVTGDSMATPKSASHHAPPRNAPSTNALSAAPLILSMPSGKLVAKKLQVDEFLPTSNCSKSEVNVAATLPASSGPSETGNYDPQEAATQGHKSALQHDPHSRRDVSKSPIATVQSPGHVGHSPAEDTATPTIQGWNIRDVASVPCRPNSTLSQADATLSLSLDGNQTFLRLPVKLEVSDLPSLIQLAAKEPTINIVRTVMAKDFDHILWSEALRAQRHSIGGIIFQTNDTAMQNLLELSKAHSTGYIGTITERNSKMLCYPGNAEEWRFIENQAVSSESPFRFCLLEDISMANLQQEQKSGFGSARSSAVIIGQELAGLEQDQLMPARETHSNDPQPVFLIFPSTHQVELEVYTKYFQSMGAQVYSSETKGAWSYFRRKYFTGSLVVIHPETRLWQVPGLYELVNSRGGRVRVFSIGIDRTAAILAGRDSRFSCWRLFPHGSVTLITDSVFAYHPENAAEVLRSFRAHLKPFGARRIAARPGLKQWLLSLAIGKAHDRGSRNHDGHPWMKLYQEVLMICPADAEDESANPLPSSNLISISPALLPTYFGLWEKDEAAANEMLVDWFAGWSIMNADQHRKFVVCHSCEKMTIDENGKGIMVDQPDAQGWATKYQHIGVYSPKDVMAMYMPYKENKERK